MAEAASQKRNSMDKYLGWKTLGAFVLAYVVAWMGGAGWGLGATHIGRLLQFSAPLITTLSLSGIAVIQLIVWGLAALLVLKRRLRALAFQLHHGWWADLLVGVGMTALAILVTFIVGVKAGWLVVERWVWQTLPFEALLGTLWASLWINAQVALLEEIACRAYLLTGLREAWGRGIGLAVMALVFGVLHLPAYNAQGLPLLVLLLPAAAGTLFGWAYGVKGTFLALDSSRNGEPVNHIRNEKETRDEKQTVHVGARACAECVDRRLWPDHHPAHRTPTGDCSGHAAG